MVEIVSFRWTSSFGAIDPNISSHPKGYITLLRGRKSLGLCRICLIPIEIGREDISLFMDWVCSPEEWVTMPYSFDNTWGIVKDSGLVPSVFSFYFFLCFFVKYLMSSFLFFN